MVLCDDISVCVASPIKQARGAGETRDTRDTGETGSARGYKGTRRHKGDWVDRANSFNT